MSRGGYELVPGWRRAVGLVLAGGLGDSASPFRPSCSSLPDGAFRNFLPSPLFLYLSSLILGLRRSPRVGTFGALFRPNDSTKSFDLLHVFAWFSRFICFYLYLLFILIALYTKVYYSLLLAYLSILRILLIDSLLSSLHCFVSFGPIPLSRFFFYNLLFASRFFGVCRATRYSWLSSLRCGCFSPRPRILPSSFSLASLSSSALLCLLFSSLSFLFSSLLSH